jgi:hypothetical protein
MEKALCMQGLFAFENRWKAGRRGLRMNADVELWTTS